MLLIQRLNGLPDFPTGISVATYAFLDRKQLVFCMGSGIMDTITSLKSSHWELIPVSEAHDLLIKIHDLLDKDVSQQVGNAACILAFRFNSTS